MRLTYRPGTEDAFALGDSVARRAKRAVDAVAAALRLLKLDKPTIAEAMRLASLDPITSSAAWGAMSDALDALFAVGGPIDAAHLRGWAHAEAALLELHQLGVLPQDLRDVAAEVWLREHGAVLVRDVLESTRAGIQRALVDALQTTDRRLQKAARAILRTQGLALDRGRYAQLVGYGREQAGRGHTVRQLEALMRKRHDKLLLDRARTIGRHELRTAGEQGKRDLWRAAAGAGRLDPSAWVIEWVTRVARVCPRCQALDGQVVHIYAVEWRSNPVVGAGKLSGRIETPTAPPLHVRCYCGTRLVRVADLPAEQKAVVLAFERKTFAPPRWLAEWLKAA